MRNHPEKSITIPPNVELEVSKTLQRILGFVPHDTLLSKSDKKEMYTLRGEHMINLHSNIDSIFIYCGIVTPQLVGHDLVPLLRIIPLSDMDSLKIIKEFTQPHYVPVGQRYIDSIEIDIRDSYGQNIKFSDVEPVMLKVHFRRSRFFF